MSREYPCVYYDNEKCNKFSEDGLTSYCVLGPCSHETPSNADRIRAMTDEELALFLSEWGQKSKAWCSEYGETLGYIQEPYGGAAHEKADC